MSQSSAPSVDLSSPSRITTAEENLDYDRLLQRMQSRIALALLQEKHLFVVDVKSLLYPIYLMELDPTLVQYHTCSCCSSFLKHYGSLVSINADGVIKSVLWDEADAKGTIYEKAVARMRLVVETSRIKGQFYTSTIQLGQKQAGGWSHFSVALPDSMRLESATATAKQAMAFKREDFGILMRSLGEWPAGRISQAVALLESDVAYRGEKVLGAAQFLRDARVAIDDTPNEQLGRNKVWRMVASAPPGHCRPRSTMIGTLLDDLGSDLGVADVLRKFKSKMDPLSYQRPQAAPKVGAINHAEKLVEQMGLAASLRRRYARLEDVTFLWKPTPQDKPTGEGVFDHLRLNANKSSDMTLPLVNMSVVKFLRDILPNAFRMQVHLGPVVSFASLVTASDPMAPPIVQWDEIDSRNPVTWSMPAHGAHPNQFGLSVDWIEVPGIARLPHEWGSNADKYKHHGNGLFFFMEGAKPIRAQGLFPEHTRGDLHAVRSVIERHFGGDVVEDLELGTANAIKISNTLSKNATFNLRAHCPGVTHSINLDRWE